MTLNSIPYLMLDAAVLLVFIAAGKAFGVWRISGRGSKTEGKVVELDRTFEGVTPIVEFKAQDKKAYRFRVETIRSGENWSVGKKWAVIYNASNPNKAYVNRPVQMWGQVLVLLVLALVIGAVSQLLRYVLP